MFESKLGAPVDVSQFVLDELGVGVLPPNECPIVLQCKRESSQFVCSIHVFVCCCAH